MKRFANEFRAILSLSKEKGYKRKTGGKSLKRDRILPRIFQKWGGYTRKLGSGLCPRKSNATRLIAQYGRVMELDLPCLPANRLMIY